MKTTILILSFSLFLHFDLLAQASAVMQVSVEIISGVKAQKTSNLYLTVDDNSDHDGEVIISATPLSDVFIFVDDQSVLTNSIGETIQIQTDSLITSNEQTGTRAVSVSGSLPKKQINGGRFTGTITTTIVYL